MELVNANEEEIVIEREMGSALDVSTQLKMLEESEAALQKSRFENEQLGIDLERAREASTWLKQKFEELQAEFAKYRSVKAEELAQTTAALTQATAQLGNESDAHSKFELERQENERERQRLLQRLESMEKVSLTKESAFRSEVESQNRLLELHQKRCDELETLNGDLLAQLTECEHAIELINEQSTSLRQQLSQAANSEQAGLVDDDGNYGNIAQLRANLAAAKREVIERDSLLQVEHQTAETLAAAKEQLQEDYESAISEKVVVEKELARVKGRCTQLENAASGYMQQSRDLAQQVSVLVRELDAVQSGSRTGTLTAEEWESIKVIAAQARKIPRLAGSGDQSYICLSESPARGGSMPDDSFASSTSVGASESNVSYRNVDEMQIVNLKLLQMNRSLKRQLEKAAIDYQAKITKAESRALANTLSKVEQLQEQVNDITVQAEELKRERDELRSKLQKYPEVMGSPSPAEKVDGEATIEKEAYNDLLKRFQDTAEGYRVLEEQCVLWQNRHGELSSQVEDLKSKIVNLEQRSKDLSDAVDFRDKECQSTRLKLVEEMDKRAGQQSKYLAIEEELFKTREQFSAAKLQIMNMEAEKQTLAFLKQHWSEERSRFTEMIDEMQRVHQYNKQQQLELFEKQTEQLSSVESALAAERKRTEVYSEELKRAQQEKDSVQSSLQKQIEVYERQLLFQKEELLQKQAALYSMERQVQEAQSSAHASAAESKESELATEKLESLKSQYQSEIEAKEVALSIAKQNVTSAEQLLQTANEKHIKLQAEYDAKSALVHDLESQLLKRQSEFDERYQLAEREKTALEKLLKQSQEDLAIVKEQLKRLEGEIEGERASKDESMKRALAQLNNRWLQKFDSTKEHIAGWKHKFEASEERVKGLMQVQSQLEQRLNEFNVSAKKRSLSPSNLDVAAKKHKSETADAGFTPSETEVERVSLVANSQLPLPNSLDTRVLASPGMAEFVRENYAATDKSFSAGFANSGVPINMGDSNLSASASVFSEIPDLEHEPEIEELRSSDSQSVSMLGDDTESSIAQVTEAADVEPEIVEPSDEPEPEVQSDVSLPQEASQSDLVVSQNLALNDDKAVTVGSVEEMEESVDAANADNFSNTGIMEMERVEDVMSVDISKQFEEVEASSTLTPNVGAQLPTAANHDFESLLAAEDEPNDAKEVTDKALIADKVSLNQNEAQSLSNSVVANGFDRDEASEALEASPTVALRKADTNISDFGFPSSLEAVSSVNSEEEASTSVTGVLNSATDVGDATLLATVSTPSKVRVAENAFGALNSDTALVSAGTQRDVQESFGSVAEPQDSSKAESLPVRKIIRLPTSSSAATKPDGGALSTASPSKIIQLSGSSSSLSKVNDSKTPVQKPRIIRLTKSSATNSSSVANNSPLQSQIDRNSISQQSALAQGASSDASKPQQQGKLFNRQNSKQFNQKQTKGNKAGFSAKDDAAARQALIEQQREEQRKRLLESMQSKQLQKKHMEKMQANKAAGPTIISTVGRGAVHKVPNK